MDKEVISPNDQKALDAFVLLAREGGSETTISDNIQAVKFKKNMWQVLCTLQFQGSCTQTQVMSLQERVLCNDKLANSDVMFSILYQCGSKSQHGAFHAWCLSRANRSQKGPRL